MNKNLILFTSILLFLGLFGIGIVQIFWLKGAIKSREQDFDKAVFEAMNDMSIKIEDLSYKPILSKMLQSQKIHTNEYGEVIIEMSDDNADYESAYAEPPHGEFPSKGKHKKNKAIQPNALLPMYEDANGVADNSFPLEIDNLQQFMAQQMTSLQPITEILDTTKLKEIITAELNSHGIKTKVKYGVTEYAPNNFVLLSKQAPLAELFRTPYSVDLFRRSMFDDNKKLKLIFPDKKKYLYSTMSPMILSSSVFFLMVVAAFFLSFQIIFRQKKLSDMKTDFINNMTHELKTPIATISIASEMLKDNSISASQENRAKYAGIIFDENKRLYNHVEQVLQIARLEKGELQLNFEDRDVHAIITATANRFNLRLEELQGSIALQLNAEQSIFKIDEMHFTNVINNLIDNAIKYNDKAPLIKINTFNIITGIQIEVIDNGVGLAKEDQQKVFEKFYRVTKGNVHDTKGFGLGLSYVQSIIDKHSGKVWVESKIKEGSTFIIQLPSNV
ncbi:MAG TPA: HAMP domain-containing sensor histidine kinase [Chitinophagales bacterium]|nr:HAMP domain-containing sensor histidine kinase [Chitinophagales bacterium]HMW12527.1 HAMP domain-containing sensor histidine kinase [Chitinophagales bacterium]HNA38681.1 HAMP domain-containing sensor histidine kinase [Chitinophagales bacterium]HNK11602.1 HAMP domain-containing sensor histidine kinase [Chitinophagales bacterium]HNL57598.1 HAMP domain-containing sensor histidine kinase [Chitinophagales bacterium]